MHKKTIALLLATTSLIAMLAACGDKEGAGDGEETEGEPEETAIVTIAPEPYSLGENSIPAPSFVVTSEPDDTDSTEKTYEYNDLADPAADVRAYVAEMRAEENGYNIVDENYYIADAPDYSEPEGSVTLAKAAQEEGQTVVINLSWTEDSCIINISTLPGITIAPQPETMTITEMEDYINRLSPGIFGLDGDSMEEYEFYIGDGAVVVDENSCVKVSIYALENPSRTNQIMGTYFLAVNGTHLYEYDSETHDVNELPLRAAG